MLIQIPDLGVVVAANQRGRAGVFTLAQLDGAATTTTTAAAAAAAAAATVDAESDTEAVGAGTAEATSAGADARSSSSSDKNSSKGVADLGTGSASYAFRLDHILPTLDQEVSGKRPEKESLIGIAAAPMQGVKPCGGHRNRWRLVLTYSNCTVLSYEVKRLVEGEVEMLVL